ncbi:MULTISPECIES: hypothetical protein [Pedobacter]|uniref:Uncharacterized protein n=1 Tax=Pedobacter heparinus (strain ATCC 13125 / DSM 2366 / CIP 104194 / JCM 7457 / NBRC 12017 / NCIMB 9290 / NRRL B-14731 / HIM 762-3) TaxID=485917 RepID=C6Y1J0_PEDHD|nr:MULTISPECIES: hypothetical protein [Pedobacter]ACU02966.1 hypothetical protein Phep_0744 [Pedobacter heparinus DSM 2366]MBB5440668.1 hypothetical protein [Pedobacter sp. AK017]
MNKFTLSLKMSFFLLICLVFMGFNERISDEYTVYIQKKLAEHYDSRLDEAQIKRYELNVTNRGFCRYKRYFNSGKVEYFSFNLVKFKDLDYYGTDKSGKLYLRTKGEDVIVQTYNDKSGGDIDSMAAYMMIPLKDIEPQDLADLSERLVKMNAQLLAQK